MFIHVIGTLKPPRVYRVSAMLSGKAPRLGSSLFLARRHRDFKRIRDKRKLSAPAVEPRRGNEGLQATALAVAGHKFAGSGRAISSAWRLSPGP